ncbi:hypothetical protein BDY24DRAFT_435682, partial [Mrakia frigida]|uniref:uncharacterized protein n=1 Tax=Mrakia frigida TaxID=29902 RepID=UPI003FCC012F
MLQSRTRIEPRPVVTGIFEYHLDVYMTAAPQVAVNQDKQPVWERTQPPNIYAILNCTAEDKVRGKKPKVTIRVVNKGDGKEEPVELDILRLHKYQHEPNTKPPILQARSQDLSWQVRWRTTLKPKVVSSSLPSPPACLHALSFLFSPLWQGRAMSHCCTSVVFDSQTEPDLYRRAQMTFLSSAETEDFISKIAPLLNTRRLAATSAPSSSTKASASVPAPPSSSSSSILSSSTSAASVQRIQTAFQPPTAQDDGSGSSSSSSPSGSGSSSSKSKGKSKRKELDPVDEATEDEDATAPSSETERQREKESAKKKKKKQRRVEVASPYAGHVEEPPQPLPSTSPSTSTATASRQNQQGQSSSSNSTTSPEGSFSPTPSRPRMDDASLQTTRNSSNSGRASKPTSSSNRSPGRCSTSRPAPTPPSLTQNQNHHHHDPLYYRRSPSPTSPIPKSSPLPLQPQPVASTSKPRSAPTSNNLVLSDLAGLDFGNGPSVGGPSTASTTPRKGGRTNDAGSTDSFSLIDFASPLVSPLKASNVLP